jgi:rfaE bifunctional protein kinase chain/domain
MLRLDRGNRGPLSLRLEAALSRRVERAAREADAVVVSDYGAGVVGPSVRAVLRGLSASGLTVCVDSRFSLREFEGVTICKPNEPELGQLVGLPVGTDAQLFAAGRRALELLKCQALLVTRGRNGMAVFSPGAEPELIPVHGGADAVYVTGAGDTVIAAFTLALSAGASFTEAARLANVAGGLVVQKLGTATVSGEELKAALSP